MIAFVGLGRRAVVGGHEPAQLVASDAGHVERVGRGRRDAGPVASFVARSKPMLRGLGAAIAFIVLILWNHPTALTVLGIGVVLVVYLVVIELLGRSATHDPVADTTAT